MPSLAPNRPSLIDASATVKSYFGGQGGGCAPDPATDSASIMCMLLELKQSVQTLAADVNAVKAAVLFSQFQIESANNKQEPNEQH